MSGQLDSATFLSVVKDAPLVSIDLIVTSERGRVLLGRRVGEPARNMLFVPGGRIDKGKSLEVAFREICSEELGPNDFSWDFGRHVVGVYTHIYDTNFLQAPGISTHYVVIACRLRTEHEFELPPREPASGEGEPGQHSETEWVDREDLDDDTLRRQIHPYTRAYLDLLPTLREGHFHSDPAEAVWVEGTQWPVPVGAGPAMNGAQYRLLNARRDTANNLVWQAPVVGLTGIAFLFTVLLAGDTSRLGRILAAALAVVVCAASWQLTAKQRFTEENLARLAQAYEDAEGLYPLNMQVTPGNGQDDDQPKPLRRLIAPGTLKHWLLQCSSVRVWGALYGVIAIVAVCAALLLR